MKEFDIVYLQETHSKKLVEKLWRSQWGGRIYYSNGANNARGTAILIRKTIPLKIMFQEKDHEGRWLLLSV